MRHPPLCSFGGPLGWLVFTLVLGISSDFDNAVQLQKKEKPLPDKELTDSIEVIS